MKPDSDLYRHSVQRLHEFFKTPRTVRTRGSTFHNDVVLTVSLIACSKTMKKQWFEGDGLVGVGGTILRMEGDIEFPATEKLFFTDPGGKRIAHSEDYMRSFWRGDFPSFLDPTIQTYLCALMIALPGTVRVTANVWIVEGKRHPFSSRYVSQIHESVEYLIENGIAPSSALQPNDAIKWVFAQNGIFDGYSDTPASKGLNFFTRLFVRDYRNDELSELVWALAGIESILVEGGRSSVGQLREKLVALFPTKQSPEWLLSMIGAVTSTDRE